MRMLTISRFVSWGALAGAIALTSTACGPTKYLTFQVWEGQGQTSEAKKRFGVNMAIGGYHDEVWALLENNDVDGAIARIESEQDKGSFGWYDLAILYEVKHNWTKAEEAINEAQKAHEETFGKPDDKIETEKQYIMEHKAKYGM